MKRPTANFISFQVLLIEEVWCELFIIACAQWNLLPPDWLEQVVESDHCHSNNDDYIQTLGALKSVINSLQSIKLDDKEAAFLKFISLFNSRKLR